MINRFKFHHEDEGRTIHCVVVEIPRKGARVPCVSAGGKFYRVPASLLKHEPTGSPITDAKAAELIERGFTHLMNKRERAQLARDRRAELDRQFAELLGTDYNMDALLAALA